MVLNKGCLNLTILSHWVIIKSFNYVHYWPAQLQYLIKLIHVSDSPAHKKKKTGWGNYFLVKTFAWFKNTGKLSKFLFSTID